MPYVPEAQGRQLARAGGHYCTHAVRGPASGVPQITYRVPWHPRFYYVCVEAFAANNGAEFMVAYYTFRAVKATKAE